MIELTATADSVDQAKALVNAGVDTLYIGNEQFGLRLPTAFSQEEIKEITEFAHAHNKRVCVAVNALMHNEHIEKVVPYLEFLQSIGVDSITVGDPGVIHLLKKHAIKTTYVYDAQTLVTSSRQVNFWAQRGAVGAVLAREITFEELKTIRSEAIVPVELLVYGATCIHHSKRPLIENYFNFTKETVPIKELFISEPKKPNTHYSIFEDTNGTHVFATNDINLLPHLDALVEAGLTQWKLDGIFTRGNDFVEIARIFIEAKRAIIAGDWSTALQESLNEQIIAIHPKERTLDEGFLLKDPNDVK